MDPQNGYCQLFGQVLETTNIILSSGKHISMTVFQNLNRAGTILPKPGKPSDAEILPALRHNFPPPQLLLRVRSTSFLTHFATKARRVGKPTHGSTVLAVMSSPWRCGSVSTSLVAGKPPLTPCRRIRGRGFKWVAAVLIHKCSRVPSSIALRACNMDVPQGRAHLLYGSA